MFSKIIQPDPPRSVARPVSPPRSRLPQTAADHLTVELGDAVHVVPGGKHQGARFCDLDWAELVALRRDQEVPRRLVEDEIRRRLRLKRREPGRQRTG